MENQNESFKPYIPADKVVPEFTPVSILLGGILGNWGGLAFFAVLIALMLAFIFGGKKNKE